MVLATRRGDPTPYDFRKPNKFSREHIRAVQVTGETWARQLATLLSTTLRTVTHVKCGGLVQTTYDEAVRQLPNPTYLVIITLDPLPGAAILHVPIDAVLVMIDRMLGGPGEQKGPLRPLTEIERSLVRTVIHRALAELRYAFEPLVEIQPELLRTESNPQFAQVATTAETVLNLDLDVAVGDARSTWGLVLPFAMLEPLLDQLASKDRSKGDGALDLGRLRGALSERVGEAVVELRVRFRDVSLPSSEIVGLRPGDVLSLEHPVGVPLTVSIEGVPCFAAQPGRRGKHLACQIVEAEEVR
jgi:flagellar motor switch protein FliM